MKRDNKRLRKREERLRHFNTGDLGTDVFCVYQKATAVYNQSYNHAGSAVTVMDLGPEGNLIKPLLSAVCLGRYVSAQEMTD